MNHRKKIAVVGAGISGLTVARLVHGGNDVTVYEAGDRIGGHAVSMEVPDRNGEPLRVDAGVCMFYSTGYPKFFELLSALDIPVAPSEVTVELLFLADQQRCHLDMNAPWTTAANTLLHPSQYWLLEEGTRFYRDAANEFQSKTKDHPLTLGEYLEQEDYCDEFRVFLSFLCGATWTLNQRGVDELPVAFVARTMWELGFLPQVRHGRWQHVPGSVKRYLDAISEPLTSSIRCQCPVEKVERERERVVVYAAGQGESYDEVIFAIPPGRALACLSEPHETEERVLSAFSTQAHTVLFTSQLGEVQAMDPEDVTLFAATDGYQASMDAGKEFAFRAGFANLSKMCGYPTAEPLYMWYQFPDAPWPEQCYERIDFTTPRFNHEALQAQNRHHEISGADRIHYCGASWLNGIHEGGVRSALRVAEAFGRSLYDI